MPEKVRRNLNICLFWGVKTTSPSQPSRDAALTFFLHFFQKGVVQAENRVYVSMICSNKQPTINVHKIVFTSVGGYHNHIT